MEMFYDAYLSMDFVNRVQVSIVAFVIVALLISIFVLGAIKKKKSK